MTNPLRVRMYVGRGLRVTTVVAALLAAGGWDSLAQATRVNAQAAALDDFQKRLAGYLELRAQLAGTLKPLSTTLSASDLAARQESLAAALREARKTAKPGDLVPAAVADLIRATVADDLKQRSATAKRATLEEVPVGPPPAINKTYPAQAALPTVPPLLLKKLPQLPDNLQYRFYSRNMIILDGDVEIIVDDIPNVLPPR